MLSFFLNIIPNLINGVSSYFNKKMDTAVQTKRIEAETRKDELGASVQVLTIFKDQIEVRISRALLLIPTSLWCALGFWDKIVETKFPHLVWVVKSQQNEALIYLPYAVMVFLLGNMYLNRKNS